ncbi:hypothetical protein OH491_05245 [Termitidicoccus mucosus]|uniref:hypothetical protein n=1 Tax=Termitidicoccus mucosus TaxID=1184151 RepID=UPI003182D645
MGNTGWRQNGCNKLLSVKANGGKIAEIRAGNRVLASVEWSASENPSVLRCGKTVMCCRGRAGADGADHRRGDRTAIIELSYNKNGLVERVRRIGAKDMNVSWKANRGYGRGDSLKTFQCRENQRYQIRLFSRRKPGDDENEATGRRLEAPAMGVTKREVTLVR